jgi:DNA-binding NarL/FixJ family response regulator
MRFSVFGRIPLARPEFKPTHEQRHSVMLGRAVGMSNRDIAASLRIDEKTLTKHFARELLHGRAIIRQELLAMVTDSALKGKKSAIVLLERMTREDRQLLR